MKYVKIYGERNTNTNYLGELIRLNLDVSELPGVVPRKMRRIQTKLPAKNLLRDVYFAATYSQNLGWKHSMVRDVAYLKKFEFVQKGEVGFITITKNPYSWLLSLFKRPYHQYYKEDLDFNDFLETRWRTVYRENIIGRVSNPVELWNLKNYSYLGLSGLDAINLRSEDIFDDAERVVTEVGQRFGLKSHSDEFVNFEESTKYENKDSKHYRDYYVGEKWKDSLSEQNIEIINKYLDNDLMQKFGYELL